MRLGPNGSSRVLGGGSDPVYVGAGSRDRNGRSITGSAVLRGTSPLIGAGEPWLRYAGYPFSPWGRWYPWYTGGWGWGYVSYDPWRVGSTRWVWGRYGMWWYSPSPWYDPWYDPNFGWYGNYSYGPYFSTSSGASEPRKTTGSLRIKVNASAGKVYVDGVLQGTVDDFDGLKNHLDVEAGPHVIEIRAEGYTTLRSDITVDAGKTQTFRGTLKKAVK